ncbi:MAG: orotate phosphoribosyltransferase [Candidatus Latescibacteria bacterium]|nr:orotate phosphoribosyltransferase [Candidatus Latescibacterota bacterium]
MEDTPPQNQDIVQWLIETKALEIAPVDRPFWYTSGTFGPYYINTHYLYGSKEKAEVFLALIDQEKEHPLTCPVTLLDHARTNYESDPIYRAVVDRIIEVVKAEVGVDAIDAISGGERRDWFFSLIVGDLLGKPLLVIYKDRRVVSVENHQDGARNVTEVGDLSGKRILHIADLITEASSYLRSWIPAIEELGGHLTHSIVVVDRHQGGRDVLQQRRIQVISFVRLDRSFFELLLTCKYIDSAQFGLLCDYAQDPKAATETFLRRHPDFLSDALTSDDDRVAARARLFVENLQL